MAQNITIKIAGKEFPLSSSGEESERMMRLAAEDVGKLLAKYDAKMPDRSLEDKLILVALGETVEKIRVHSRISEIAAEADSLKSEIAGYLASVDK